MIDGIDGCGPPRPGGGESSATKATPVDSTFVNVMGNAKEQEVQKAKETAKKTHGTAEPGDTSPTSNNQVMQSSGSNVRSTGFGIVEGVGESEIGRAYKMAQVYQAIIALRLCPVCQSPKHEWGSAPCSLCKLKSA